MIIFTETDHGDLYQEEAFTSNIYKHNAELVRWFLELKKLEGASSNTIKSYGWTLRHMSEAIGRKFDTLTTKVIRKYLTEYQQITNSSNSNIDHIRLTLNSFYTFLFEEDLCRKNPMKKIHAIKKEKIVELPYSDEELLRIQEFPLTLRDRAIIDLLYSSGCRVSELCDLNIDDIDLRAREGMVYGKGKKSRIIYFDVKAKLHITSYLATREDDHKALFVTETIPVHRVTVGIVQNLCKTLSICLNIDDIHPHRFRRTLATNLLKKGMPIEQVQKILGHSSIQTTMIYAKVNQDDVKANHARFI